MSYKTQSNGEYGGCVLKIGPVGAQQKTTTGWATTDKEFLIKVITSGDVQVIPSFDSMLEYDWTNKICYVP